MAARISSGVWPGSGHGVEDEEAGIFIAGKAAEAFRTRCDALVADQAAIEAAGAAVGEDVGDGVVDGVVGIAIVGAMVALDVEGLRRFANDD